MEYVMRSGLERERKATDVAAPPFDWDKADSSAWVHVVATGERQTAAALKEAAKFAQFAGQNLCVDVFYVVPFALPLDEPDIPAEHLRSRFKDVISATGVEACTHVVLCRSYADAMRKHFDAPTVIYLGCRNTFWPSREKQLARLLRRLGHSVTLVTPEAKR